ncbi:MAG: hypothetical protein ABI821_03015 [Pseudomonadota bacterium]
MNGKSTLALALLLAVAGNSWSQDAVGNKPDPDETRVRIAAPAAPSFSLHDDNVQKIVVAAAQKQSESATESDALNDPVTATAPIAVKFKAPRRVDHTDCDSFNCVAYNADEIALFTIPREQYFGVHGDKPADGWLSCQSRDDLLTTFERYDKCRGITIGLPPVSFGNVMLDTPKLTF